jgi:hypothetical protein
VYANLLDAQQILPRSQTAWYRDIKGLYMHFPLAIILSLREQGAHTLLSRTPITTSARKLRTNIVHFEPFRSSTRSIRILHFGHEEGDRALMVYIGLHDPRDGASSFHAGCLNVIPCYVAVDIASESDVVHILHGMDTIRVLPDVLVLLAYYTIDTDFVEDIFMVLAIVILMIRLGRGTYSGIQQHPKATPTRKPCISSLSWSHEHMSHHHHKKSYRLPHRFLMCKSTSRFTCSNSIQEFKRTWSIFSSSPD